MGVKGIQNNAVLALKPLLNTKLAKRLISLWHTKINEQLLGSYSQKGEDLIIEKLLGKKKDGFYVDVGANHPTACSNTYRFYKKGWRGINIEPNQINIQKFRRIREEDINLGIGISQKKGKMVFYEFFETALSTFSKEEAEKNIKVGKKLKQKVTVSVEKLSDVLNKYAKGKEIDFFSIDTEGFDMEVLKSNDWNNFKPTIICLETAGRGYTEDYSQEFMEYLSKYGYKIAARTRLNTIYMRETR